MFPRFPLRRKGIKYMRLVGGIIKSDDDKDGWIKLCLL
jgi:hypothetical protein